MKAYVIYAPLPRHKQGEHMFGHDDTNDQTNQAGQATAEPQADATLAPAPTEQPSAPTVDAAEVDEALKALSAHTASTESSSGVVVTSNANPVSTDTPAEAVSTETPVETPVETELPADVTLADAAEEVAAVEPTEEVTEPETVEPETVESEVASEDVDEAPVLSGDESDQLLDLKQSALQQLTPLIDQLDQTPEEKFRTTMMMIQASDNQSLLQSAYDAAQQIDDEKTKAQALLDIVNEINYFTQQADGEEETTEA